MVMTPDAAEMESPEDFGTDPGAAARRWIAEIELAETDQQAWRARARRIIQLYRRSRPGEVEVKGRRFALFWSNDWTGASGIGYVGAARMQVNLISDPGTPVLEANAMTGDLLGIDGAGDNLQTASGLPFDVPCQLLGFDLVYEPGGQV
jgi:hypothetical protein